MTKEEYKQWILKAKNNRTRIFHKQCEKCIHEANKCILSGLQGQNTCNSCACLEPHKEYFACRCESKPTYIEKHYTKKCRYFKEDKDG